MDEKSHWTAWLDYGSCGISDKDVLPTWSMQNMYFLPLPLNTTQTTPKQKQQVDIEKYWQRKKTALKKAYIKKKEKNIVIEKTYRNKH